MGRRLPAPGFKPLCRRIGAGPSRQPQTPRWPTLPLMPWSEGVRGAGLGMRDTLPPWAFRLQSSEPGGLSAMPAASAACLAGLPSRSWGSFSIAGGDRRFPDAPPVTPHTLHTTIIG